MNHRGRGWTVSSSLQRESQCRLQDKMLRILIFLLEQSIAVTQQRPENAEPVPDRVHLHQVQV